ncbi:MAG: diaminopimelate epimerase [Clostridiales bacterium]|jgi:diaminopimelate epimerase|nr:diaminopimelate epimerase [Clostridiales bacterium]
MRFTKVHGAGNDFILIDACLNSGYDFRAIAPMLCHRHTGIGADGLLIAEPSASCDIRMRIINSDGSEAEMCGNGIRAFSKYAYERGLVNKQSFTVETLSGVIEPTLLLTGGNVTAVRVNMGNPLFHSADIPVAGEGNCLNRTLCVNEQTFVFSAVRVGVPHAIIEVEDPKTFAVNTIGPMIERDPLFPERINVDFYRVLDRENIEMRVWERGAGPTLACGTGACATAVLCAANGKTERRAYVHLALDTLFIEWPTDGDVYMTGPAQIVFDGEASSQLLKTISIQ